jgi:lysophospholipase L1-like esterase
MLDSVYPKMQRLQVLDGDQPSLEALRALITSGISNEDVRSVAHTLSKEKLRCITSERLIDNVLLARSVFKPNALYGTRLAAHQNVLIDVDALGAKDIDLLVTDDDGIVKNRTTDDDTQKRRAHARASNKKVITFFGGSTIMGTGCRLPAFTIPSLVEQILSLKYQIDSVCINRGILGMTSQDSFNMLVSDELRTPPDMVIFYTGWNCIFNQSAVLALLDDNSLSISSNAYLGMSTRHIEHGMHLNQQFNRFASLKRTFWLCINTVLSKLAALSHSKKYRAFFDQCLKLDPTVSHSFVPEIIESISQGDTKKIAADCARDYLRLSTLARACCHVNGVGFLNFLQPCLSWGEKIMTLSEQEFVNQSPPMGGVQRAFYEQVVASTTPEYFHDLGRVFDSTREQVYIDTGHLNPHGNFIVAEKIADQIAIEMQQTRTI